MDLLFLILVYIASVVVIRDVVYKLCLSLDIVILFVDSRTVDEVPRVDDHLASREDWALLDAEHPEGHVYSFAIRGLCGPAGLPLVLLQGEKDLTQEIGLLFLVLVQT